MANQKKSIHDLMVKLMTDMANQQAAVLTKAQTNAKTMPQGYFNGASNGAGGFNPPQIAYQGSVQTWPVNITSGTFTTQPPSHPITAGCLVQIAPNCAASNMLGNTVGTVMQVMGNRARVSWGPWGDATVNLSELVLLQPRGLGGSGPPEKTFKFDETKMEPLIIADDTKKEIMAVLKQHKHYKTLFEKWGLAKTIEYGRGMTFLFWGPPGTGKTWGANCIAKTLGTTLLTISAAEIQSSEPGGANRAIQQAFETADHEKQVLFIDECDSLIASRNDLGMILSGEVNTLLTEIEKFEGVCILATNRVDEMDAALERRIALIAEFPMPTREQRRAIWDKLIPGELPFKKEDHLDELSDEVLSGGQIKNVVLQAARLAVADEKDSVVLAHFEQAIARVKKSKNLMGKASRYRQGYRQDMGTDITKTKIKGFLDD